MNRKEYEALVGEYKAMKAAGYPGIPEPLRTQLLRHDRCIECAGGNLMCNGDAQRGGKSWDLCAKNPVAPLLPERS